MTPLEQFEAGVQKAMQELRVDRAKWIADQPNPASALLSASIRDAAFELSQPQIEALILYGEADMTRPTEDEMKQAVERALERNMLYQRGQDVN